LKSWFGENTIIAILTSSPLPGCIAGADGDLEDVALDRRPADVLGLDRVLDCLLGGLRSREARNWSPLLLASIELCQSVS